MCNGFPNDNGNQTSFPHFLDSTCECGVPAPPRCERRGLRAGDGWRRECARRDLQRQGRSCRLPGNLGWKKSDRREEGEHGKRGFMGSRAVGEQAMLGESVADSAPSLPLSLLTRRAGPLVCCPPLRVPLQICKYLGCGWSCRGEWKRGKVLGAARESDPSCIGDP